MKKNFKLIAFIAFFSALCASCGSGKNDVESTESCDFDESNVESTVTVGLEDEEKIDDTPKTEKEIKMSQKVLKSVETSRPAFKQSYFEDAQEAEGFDWNEQGVLSRSGGEFVTYGCFNDRMNQAVCEEAGKKKCEQLAKKKGWEAIFGTETYGSVCGEDGWPIDWYILHEELSKL